MYSAEVTLVVIKGVEYIQTLFFKDNVIHEAPKLEKVSSFDLLQNENVLDTIKSISEQKIAIINIIKNRA